MSSNSCRPCRSRQTHYQRDPLSLRWHRRQGLGRISAFQHRPRTAKVRPEEEFVASVSTGGVGRVEVWRGDVRPSMSVSAPFVWRCLSGSTVAPFPHPAHRTGRADLSGSSAIAGFRPHRTHHAALPQWALQKGPEACRSLPPCLMDRRSREGEGIQELAEGHPVHAALLAAFAERLAPLPDDAVLEHAQ